MWTRTGQVGIAKHSEVATQCAVGAEAPKQDAVSTKSTVTFKPSGSSVQCVGKVSDLKLTALLKLCALDDQGVEVVWPNGLDYAAALELLDAHDAIDLDQVEAWKKSSDTSPAPAAVAMEHPSSDCGSWCAQSLADLIELHEDGLPVTWPKGLNLALAKEQLRKGKEELSKATTTPTTLRASGKRSAGAGIKLSEM